MVPEGSEAGSVSDVEDFWVMKEQRGRDTEEVFNASKRPAGGINPSSLEDDSGINLVGPTYRMDV